MGVCGGLVAKIFHCYEWLDKFYLRILEDSKRILDVVSRWGLNMLFLNFFMTFFYLKYEKLDIMLICIKITWAST